jgi:hypothetical protein
MALFLAQAVDLEARQLAAGERGAPLSSAHETAGDLWLQVHRYEDARLAYQRAAALLGDTPRLAAGFARVAARTGDEVIACYQFRALLTWWNGRAGTLPEIAEAREYVREHGCRTP